jgi:drug/metabolite transporter (DMT)-like permease
MEAMNTVLLLTGISSGLAHSAYSATSKSLLKNRIPEPFLLFLYISVLQAILTPSLWLFVRPALPATGGWVPLLTSCVTCLVAYAFLYTALSSGDASSVMPIMGSKVVFAGLLAIPMLGESHHVQVYVAAILVAISIAILSYSPSPSQSNSFPLKPILLMVASSIAFAFTDIYIKRSLVFIDSFNFMIYYNLLVGAGSLILLPYLRHKEVRLTLKARDLSLSLVSAFFLLGATLLFVISLRIAEGVVIPNILQSTRGVFIVLISAVLARTGSMALETHGMKVYLLRFFASSLIIASIWIALSG